MLKWVTGIDRHRFEFALGCAQHQGIGVAAIRLAKRRFDNRSAKLLGRFGSQLFDVNQIIGANDRGRVGPAFYAGCVTRKHVWSSGRQNDGATQNSRYEGDELQMGGPFKRPN